ncbi:hypothetical protein DHD80_08865 [Gramella sp. AN32]|nr:hypothetical protein [Gramella sp. AN32]
MFFSTLINTYNLKWERNFFLSFYDSLISVIVVQLMLQFYSSQVNLFLRRVEIKYQLNNFFGKNLLNPGIKKPSNKNQLRCKRLKNSFL